MKRFSFRLQSVLDFYSLREELELIKLNDLLRQGSEVESAIKKHVEAMQNVGRELRSRKELTPQELTTSDRYQSHLREQVRQLGTQAVKLETLTTEQRELVVSASRQRKVFEALKDRQQKEHDQALGRVEQQVMDELHLQHRAGRLAAPESLQAQWTSMSHVPDDD